MTLLALFGLIDSAYLALTRLLPHDVGLVCPVGGGCATVQASAWSTFPPGGGMPIALIGVGGYLLLFTLGMLVLHTDYVGQVPLPSTLFLAASGSLVVAMYLTSIQLFIIQAVCFWCVLSALIGAGFWIAALQDWRAWRRIMIQRSARLIESQTQQAH